MGDDFDQQGVIMGGDDGSLEGRSIIQADAHALSAPEHLQGRQQSQMWLLPWLAMVWAGTGAHRSSPALACEVLLDLYW